MKQITKCTVVIPVFNSQTTLPELIKQLHDSLSGKLIDFELILVNDGSTDESWKSILTLSQKYSQVRGIDLIRNFGQHNALLCGIREANFEVIITIDDDLQNPPSEIPLLLEKLEEGYDVVYGVPEKTHQNVWRKIASNIFRWVLRYLLSSQIEWQVSSFRAFRTSIRNSFSQFSNSYVFIDALLTWGATRFIVVPVKHNYRRNGYSTYSLKKLIRLSINVITEYSTLPLRIASFTGFLFTLFGLGVLVYVIGRFIILGGSIPGFPFLASIISIYSGATLFSLGIVGEYLARMFSQTMGRNPYVIRKEVEHE